MERLAGAVILLLLSRYVSHGLINIHYSILITQTAPFGMTSSAYVRARAWRVRIGAAGTPQGKDMLRTRPFCLSHHIFAFFTSLPFLTLTTPSRHLDVPSTTSLVPSTAAAVSQHTLRRCHHSLCRPLTRTLCLCSTVMLSRGQGYQP